MESPTNKKAVVIYRLDEVILKYWMLKVYLATKLSVSAVGSENTDLPIILMNLLIFVYDHVTTISETNCNIFFAMCMQILLDRINHENCLELLLKKKTTSSWTDIKVIIKDSLFTNLRESKCREHSENKKRSIICCWFFKQ